MRFKDLRFKGDNDLLTLGQKEEKAKKHFYDVNGCLCKFKQRELDQDIIMNFCCLILRCMTTVSWSDFQYAARQADGTTIICQDDQKKILHWKEANAIRDDDSRPRWNNGMDMSAKEVANPRAQPFPIKI